MLQKVQGPRPSRTQIILPQFRQLGAEVRRGWRVARQSHFRAALSAAEGEREGFVWSSRARMAESRSERAVEAPCMGVPPERAIFVFEGGLAGEEVREGWGDGFWEGLREVVRTFGRSEIREPAAEGGFWGRWTNTGVEVRERVEESGVEVGVELDVRDEWLLGM